jgi:hypothetical protein
MPAMRVMAIALAALAATAGCKDKKKKSEPAAATAPAPVTERTSTDPDTARKRAEAVRNMQLAPVSVAEVQPLIPSLPGAEPVGQPGVLTGGRQVKAILCVPGGSADAVMKQLVTAIEGLGFSGVKTKPHPRSPDMVTLHAEKQPFRLGGTVTRSSTADCPAAAGKVKVVLSYFKRNAAIPPPQIPPASE